MRPILHIPPSPLEVILEIAAFAGVVHCVAGLVRSWASLPDRVPIHFGFDGRPDSWGRRYILLALPIVAILLYVGMSVMSRYPHTYNYPWRITEENAEWAYRSARLLVGLLKAELVWLLAWLQQGPIRVAVGEAKGLPVRFTAAALLVPLLTVVVYVVMTGLAHGSP
jgi:uncharacterized membrane protein